MYRARIEKHSISPDGVEAVSFLIEFPRVVLAETVTHRQNYDHWNDHYPAEASICQRTTTRDISKNSASSRAIPHEKMIQKIKNDPYMPFWSLAQKGMQGAVTSDEEIIQKANRRWLEARDYLLGAASDLNEIGIHKQDSNRLLEPFAWITQLVTATRWDNFFALRCHNAAHPAFRHVARMMYLLKKRSTPTSLDYGQWHLPFISREEQMDFRWVPDLAKLARKEQQDFPPLLRQSIARCAWLSYENAEKEGTQEAMDRTFQRLFAEIPAHGSPAEHQLTPAHISWQTNYPQLRSNVHGYIQARKLIPHEEVTRYEPPQEEIASWSITEEDLMWKN